jgi:hypothetical protein
VLGAALAALAVAPTIAASAAPKGPDTVPVAVYVNVDEMSALRPFRDPETHTLPGPGDTGYEAYIALRDRVLEEAFAELRRRVPKRFKLFPALEPVAPHALKIDMWIADLATTCSAPTYYKYLWVRTTPTQTGFATNWDGLGVRSETIVSFEMAPRQRLRADLDAWVELWSQVPYLHVRPVQPGEQEEAPPPEPEAEV